MCAYMGTQCTFNVRCGGQTNKTRNRAYIDYWPVSNLMINYNVNKAKIIMEISQPFNTEGIHS